MLKTNDSIRKTLSNEVRDKALKKLNMVEERLSCVIERKIESFRLQMDSIDDVVRNNARTANDMNERLNCLQETLVQLDAEHSAIVSTVRQQEIERASSNHYCYSAIDQLIDLFDKYQSHMLLEKKLPKRH